MRELLEQYVPRVYRFALRLTKDPHAAEDLTQETMLRAWRKQRLLRDARAAPVWLFRIAVNIWRDHCRRQRSPVARAGPLAADYPEPRQAAERQVADQELARKALESLDELPDQQRQALYLRACEGLSAAQIAAVLDTSADSVKASLSLARGKLRQRLRDVFENLLLFL